MSPTPPVCALLNCFHWPKAQSRCSFLPQGGVASTSHLLGCVMTFEFLAFSLLILQRSSIVRQNTCKILLISGVKNNTGGGEIWTLLELFCLLQPRWSEIPGSRRGTYVILYYGVKHIWECTRAQPGGDFLNMSDLLEYICPPWRHVEGFHLLPSDSQSALT